MRINITEASDNLTHVLNDLEIDFNNDIKKRLKKTSNRNTKQYYITRER